MGTLTNFKVEKLNIDTSRYGLYFNEDECYKFTMICEYCVKANLYDIKWYKYDTNMKEFSREFPDNTYRVKKVGGDNEEYSVHYYKDGELIGEADAKLIYPTLEEIMEK